MADSELPIGLEELRKIAEQAAVRGDTWKSENGHIGANVEPFIFFAKGEDGCHITGFDRAAHIAAFDPATSLILLNLAKDRNELQASFDLRWKADMEAIKRWRAKSPKERDLIWPSCTELGLWLLKERAKLREIVLALSTPFKNEYTTTHCWCNSVYRTRRLTLPHDDFCKKLRVMFGFGEGDHDQPSD